MSTAAMHVLALAAAVVVAGCTAGSETDVPTPTSAAPATPTVVASTSAGSTAPGRSPSHSSAATPRSGAASPASSPPATEGFEVLAGQFTAFVGAGAPGDCDDSWWDQPIEQLPYVGLPHHREEAVLGSVEALCLVGFDLSREVELAIARPDGEFRVVAVVLTGDGRPIDLLGGADLVAGFGVELETTTEGSVSWWIRPDAPVGRYDLVAVQDLAIAAGSVEVVVGTDPGLAPLPTDDPAQRRFAAFGFPSGRAAFGIYLDTTMVDDTGEGGTVFELVADLGVRTFDTTGAAVIQVEVAGLASGERHCLHSPLLTNPCAAGEGLVDPDHVPWG